jgi:hypothetical protein
LGVLGACLTRRGVRPVSPPPRASHRFSGGTHGQQRLHEKTVAVVAAHAVGVRGEKPALGRVHLQVNRRIQGWEAFCGTVRGSASAGFGYPL